MLLTAEPLEQSKYSVSALVGCPSAGALSSFLGVTRDSFQGKRVLRLEYESYDAMAIKQMHGLCAGIRARWPSVARCAILHRTGVVGVGEASVLIAVSSPHRRESLEAVAWCIDELKRVLCVWKKEWYEDGSVWKQNAEWNAHTLTGSGVDENGAIATTNATAPTQPK